jgi:DNA repair exonuclease SbcCD ATPase subunit
LKSELEKAHSTERNLRHSISNLEVTSLEKNHRIEELEKLVEAEKAAREEDLVFFRLQQMKTDKGAPVVDDVKLVAELSEAKQQFLLQRSELDEQRTRNELLAEQIRHYEKKILVLETDADRFKDKLKEVEKNSGATAVLKAEQEALLNSLRRELKNALSTKEDSTRRIKDLEEYRSRAEGQLVRLVEYKEKTIAAEERLSEAEALNSRLQIQLQTVETNHALKTAMLATIEAEIDSLKEANKVAELASANNLSTIATLQNEARETSERIALVLREHDSVIESLHKDISSLKEKHIEELKTHQENHTKEIEALMKEHSKKSSTATTLLSEREKEIKELRLKISQLKDEIASGSPSERKIFELAQSQANREASIGASM